MRFTRPIWFVLLIAVAALSFTASANAQFQIGVAIGPSVVPAQYYGAYGPPVCEWGYLPYAPYACVPYGYYGREWFVSGVFIGAGPWRGRGFRGREFGEGYERRGGDEGYRGGYANERRESPAPRGFSSGSERGYSSGPGREYAGPGRGNSGPGFGGGMRGGRR